MVIIQLIHLRQTAICGLLALVACTVDACAEQFLLDFGEDFNLAGVETSDVKLRIDNRALRLETGHRVELPMIMLKAPSGHWDLSAFTDVAIDVKNIGPNEVTVSCRVDNPDADGSQNCVAASTTLPQNGHDSLRVPLTRRLPDEIRVKLFGMRGLPSGALGQGIDPTNITQVEVFVDTPTNDHCFTISNMRAEGTATENPPRQVSDFFPLIDPFGQYVHKDWPGKIKAAEEFAARKNEEAADLANHPGPEDWDEYGGWKAGPQLTASGTFRVEKHRGKWWLVDPEGRLFWSHGIDCVRDGNAVTPITNRRHWFAGLPSPDSPFAQFYGQGDWAPMGYYQGKQYETYNFATANLLRKYGETWSQDFRELAHRRLRSWGLNTIGNWSDSAIYLMRKTPYTATVSIPGKPLAGSAGYWGKFVDVFDPAFSENARQALAQHKNQSAGDPWCIGYFVDNEQSWGDELSLAVATLGSPADQPAKQEFVADLKRKYETIERLNAAWNTQHVSWDALLKATDSPDQTKAHDDLTAFTIKTAERYFETCCAAIKEVAPNQLYLGCRFAWTNELVIRAAARYCDIVSFNRYQRNLADRRLPQGLDKPVLIGEFHFGALDRGMFHTGLVVTADQNERAEAYTTYVRSALQNPCIVGTHWFQFGDQATTGRGDGENFQIGFLDVCDTPYAETIDACRQLARDMYQYRSR